MRRAAWASLAVVLALGCQKRERRGADPAAVVLPRDAAVVVDAEAIDGDPLGGLPPLDELPSIDLKQVAAKALREAKELASAALKRHLAGDPAGAIPDYLRALALDPGHLMARYNLASAWAKTGDRGRALAVLKQFRDAGCPVCVGRLTRATKDRDWEGLWSDPGFRALTTGSLLIAPNLEQMTLQLADAFRKGDAAPIAVLLHPRTPLVVSQGAFGCVHEDCGLMGIWDQRRVLGPAAVTRWMGQFRHRHADNKIEFCDGDCCLLTRTSLEQVDGNATLLTACFHVDSGGVAFPREVIVASEDPGP